MIRSLFILLFPLLLPFISSISEDQFGEYDWAIHNIGYVENTAYQVQIFDLSLLSSSVSQPHLSQNKSIIVSTADHILASINIRSGELDWRVLLPKGELISRVPFVSRLTEPL
jgi:hypothetical protein